MTTEMQAEKAQAAQWFKTLRDNIVSTFLMLEDNHDSGPMSENAPGTFEVTNTSDSRMTAVMQVAVR